MSQARWTHDALEEVSVELSAATTAEEIAQIVVDRGNAVLGATNSALWLRQDDAAVLVRAAGYSDAMRERFTRIESSSTYVIAQTLFRGEELFVESRGDYAARWPESEQTTRALNNAAEIAFACLPLAGAGGIAFTFTGARTFDREERSLLRILARHCSVAIERARLVADLARERQLLATLLDQQPAAVVSVDSTGRMLLANRRSQELIGAPPKDLGGYAGHVVETLDGKPLAEGDLPLARALAGEHVRDFVGATHVGAERRELRVSASPVHDPVNGIVAAIATFTDITDERRNEQRLREQIEANATLHRIASALSAELDLDTLLQRLTEEATSLVGAQFGSFFYNVLNERGESYMLWTLSGVPREAFAKFPMPRNTAIFGPTFRGEAVVRFDDVTKQPTYGQNPPYYGMPKGHLPVRSYLAAPVISRSGEVLGGLFFGHGEPGMFDERDELAIASVAAHAAISIDNARLYRGEQNARKNAEEAIRVRDAFLSVASHELKTPVTAMALQLQSLRRDLDHGRLDGERAQKKLVAAERGLGKLTALVDELLDVSRLTAGRLEVKREIVDVAAVAQDVVSRFDVLARDSGSSVTVTADRALAIADPQRLDQVVTNLLSNAIKYGRGRPIEVSVGADGTHSVVRVRDYGIGIADDARARIFERFERAVEARSFAGFGLGLWITKNLVEAMGGEVVVESVLDEGSTFTARFPAAP